MIEHVVVLLLTTLPTTNGTSLDRVALGAQAGCAPYTALITVAEDSDGHWLALVRCRVVTTPTAEILRVANP